MIVEIRRPSIVNKDGKVTLSSDIYFGNEQKTIFYEIDSYYEKYIDLDNVNSFLIAILPYCMMKAKKHDEQIIVKSDCCISKILKFQLQRYLIPILAQNISYYSCDIEIQINGVEMVYPDSNGVATGVSGGVDSSYSILRNMKNQDYPLTHLLLGNIGIYGGGFNSKAEMVLEQRCERIAGAVGLPLVKIRSNACVDIYKKAFAPIVPFVFVSIVFSLPKLFKVYFFSSGYAVKDFHFADDDAAGYEIFTLSQLRTENTSFYSSGSELTRLQKERYIAGEKFVQENLQVCLNVTENGCNCNRCAKCTRTMAELETLGMLDNFNRVFDVNDFKKNPGYHWGYVLLKSWEKNPMYVELIDEKKKKKEVTFRIRIEAFRKWLKRGGTTINNKRENVWEIID